MTTQAGVTPRKLPRQRRSRVLVKRIVDAAADLLAADGYEALTTNRIAEAASVSVGSLYQYFPNKNAIVAALVEQLATGVQDDILDMLRRADPAEAPDRLTHRIVGCVVADALARADVVRALMPHLDELTRLGVLSRPEDMIRQAGRGFLAASTARLRQRNVEGALFIVVECLAHLIRRYVQAPPPGLQADAFVEMISDLTTRFLYEIPADTVTSEQR